MAAFAHPSRPASSARAPSTPKQTRSSAAPQSPSPRQLPSGPCNWRDLNVGREGSTCGCRQFWLNDVPLLSSGFLDQRQGSAAAGAWCFCGHHACFHKLRNDASVGMPGDAGQGKHDTYMTAAGELGLDFDQYGFFDQALNTTTRPPSNDGLGKPGAATTSGLGLSIAGGISRIQQTHPINLPRPSILQNVEYLPSTQSSPKPVSYSTSETVNHPRRSPSRGFMNHVANYSRPVPQVNVQDLPPPGPGEETAQSATEIATPSNAGTPALRETDEAFKAVSTTIGAFTRDTVTGEDVASHLPHVLNSNSKDKSHPHVLHGASSHIIDSSMQAQPRPNHSNVDVLMDEIRSLKALLSTTPNLRTSLLSLNNRVEALETSSFSLVPVEELQDKFEMFDGRLLDVEGKVEDLEKMQQAQTDTKSKSGKTPSANASFGSNASFSEVESSSGRDQNNVQVNYSSALSKLSSLEQRLFNLEASALPSRADPWEVEVVLLPWGRELKGIWGDAHDASQVSKFATQEISSAHSATPSQKSGTQTPIAQEVSEWTDGSPDWLSARACGPTRGIAGRVYERLKSRGFIQTVQLKGNSASKVEAAIICAFSEQILGPDSNVEFHLSGDGPSHHLLGLQAPFIPLRKIHKSSRLRHLAGGELITTSLWTAEFLNSSIFMQAPTTGHRRLFITTPASYVQSIRPNQEWTWQRLRELPRVYPPTEKHDSGSRMVGEADANEPCWAWDPRLDPPTSVHSSFSSGISYHSSLDSHPLTPRPTNDEDSNNELESSEPSDEQSLVDEEDVNEKPPRPQSPITPVSELTFLRPSQRYRTASVPLTGTQASLSASIPKRQMASFEQMSQVKNVSKRRRFSRSPDDVELMAMWNLTPRRSREPSSPGGHSSAPRLGFDARQADLARATSSKGKSMSQAYATPYSNNIAAEDTMGDQAMWSSDDTDADSASEDSSDDDGEDDDDDDSDDDDEGEEEEGNHEHVNVDMADEPWEGVDEDETIWGRPKYGTTHEDEDDDRMHDDDEEDGERFG